MDKELFIVTGASGKLGEFFIQTLQQQGKAVVGLSRKNIELGVPVYPGDLLIEKEVEGALGKIDYTLYEQFTLIHTVGKFKFEKDNPNVVDNDGDGIDDEVYLTNVVTLKNILKFLIDHVEHKSLKVCAFGSVSDKYEIPFWISYRKAKNIMRQYLKELARIGRIKALVINVSTLDTGNENLLRPNADKTYWLQPAEVVEKTLLEIKSVQSYEEIDVIKHKPYFDGSYYIDHDEILKKWTREMGPKGQIKIMNFTFNKIPLIILGITSLLLSRGMFWFFNDPEGPNLVVVIGMAAILYFPSLVAYRTSSASGIKRILLGVFVQIVLGIGFYFLLS